MVDWENWKAKQGQQLLQCKPVVQSYIKKQQMNVTEALSCLHLVTTRGLDQVVLFLLQIVNILFYTLHFTFCKITFFATCGNWSSDYLIQMIMIRLSDKNDNNQMIMIRVKRAQWCWPMLLPSWCTRWDKIHFNFLKSYKVEDNRRANIKLQVIRHLE